MCNIVTVCDGSNSFFLHRIYGITVLAPYQVPIINVLVNHNKGKDKENDVSCIEVTAIIQN